MTEILLLHHHGHLTVTGAACPGGCGEVFDYDFDKDGELVSACCNYYVHADQIKKVS